MGIRRRLLAPLVALLGAAVVVLPAAAGSETTPAIQAVNYGYYHYWSPPQATVLAGGAVTLSNPSEVKHGVEWRTGPATPSCAAGVPVGTAPANSGVKWSGTCTFPTAGTYTFWCTVHGSEMSATVTVNPNGTTTTTSTTSTQAPSPAGGSPPTAGNEPGSGATSGSPLAGGASQAVKLASSQHGKSVRGSVKVSQAGAGGRLEVDLLAKSASLAKGGHPAQVTVGRLVRSALRAGRVSFTVPLSAKARRALARHGRLALSVKIVLNAAQGSAVTITRSVALHA
jgi:plastocyanin